MIVWLTGNTGSGKTTLAKELQKRLYNWTILDGDEMRNTISLGAGFSKEEREKHNLRVARLAKLLNEKGQNVFVSVIAPFQSTRDKIDKIIDCKWVWVHRGIPKYENAPYESPMNAIELKDMTLEEEVETVIEILRLFGVFVLGAPRSGTSMKMKICSLLGVNMIYTSDKKRKEMDKLYKEKFGDYHPNKAGFYEIVDDYINSYIKILSTPYSGCKIIMPLMRVMRDIVDRIPSKIIMMERNSEEVAHSQMNFYAGRRFVDEALIRTQIVEEKIKLKERKINFIVMKYQDILDNPEREVLRLKKFINSPCDIGEAVNFIDKKAQRCKKEILIKGVNYG